jgi:histidine ammonia-lyase
MVLDMLEHGITPVIPSQGSVGASGDLVQLAHLVHAMMGKGKVWVDEKGPRRQRLADMPAKAIPSSRALARAGLKPVHLEAKEGLALINGTQMMTAFAALAVHQARALCSFADVVAGMSVEALRGSDIRGSHRYNDARVQDAYSIRCIPQVHGASRDAIRYVHGVITTEINSANDNPLIFPSDRAHLEGGNFHGQPIALAKDIQTALELARNNAVLHSVERVVGSLDS